MNIRDFFYLQITVFIYSLTSLFSKLASSQGIFSFKFFLFFGLLFLSLAIYAILWQQVLKRVSLTQAFANKGTVLLWSIFLGYIFFHESVSFFNLLGASIVMLGICVIAKGEDTNE